MFVYEYVGNLHVHTVHSDGTATVSEIAGLAAGTGLDFICLNDHAHMTDALHLEDERFYEDVLVLVGLEIGVRYHHYLAYDLKQNINQDTDSPQQMIDSVSDQGGFGFLAHPHEKGMPFLEKSIAYTWNDLTVTGFTGICIWNFSSRWKERVRTLLHGLFFLMFKTRTFKGPSSETLSLWDTICQKRSVVAIGGSDAHGSHIKWGPFHFKPLSYEHTLNTVNVHVLLKRKLPKDPVKAKEDIYGALRAGRLFIAHDRLSPAKGFRFDFLSDDGSDLFMGEEDLFRGGGEFVVELPRHGEIRLIKDGTLFRKHRGREAIFTVRERGVYRVEVFLHFFLFGWRPWIFSNPIYLR